MDENQTSPDSQMELRIAELQARIVSLEAKLADRQENQAGQQGFSEIVNDWPLVREMLTNIRDTVVEINLNLSRRTL